MFLGINYKKAKINYDKRNKFDPHFINTVIGGYMDGKAYLASVDHLGMCLPNHYALSGFATYFCNPLVVNKWHKDLTEEEARKIVHNCFEVLFYRDCK